MSNPFACHLLFFTLGLVFAPLLPGIINRVKAKFAGRKGKPILQTYFDLAKLMSKGEVNGAVATWPFRLGPSVTFATTVCAFFMLPTAGVPCPVAFGGDFVFVAYLLGMGRFALLLSSMDTGSSFEGMGASREATYGALAEPVLFLVLMVLVSTSADMSGSYSGIWKESLDKFSLSTFLGGQTALACLEGRAEIVLVPLVLFVLLLVENCRIPVDDPNTHLELTMIHEVMVLDHSGVNLAIIHYGAALKLLMFSSIIAGIVIPTMPFWQHFVAYCFVVFIVAVMVGLVESTMSRLRLYKVPHLVSGAGTLAALSLILTLIR